MQVQLEPRFAPSGDDTCPRADGRGTPPRLDGEVSYEQFASASSPSVARFTTNLVGTSVQQQFAREFEKLAADPEAFHTLLGRTFGPNYDRSVAEALRQRALAGDISWLPNVRFVSGETLHGAHGAYDGASKTVLINQSLRGNAQLLLQTYAEEAGHHLDTLLNARDTPGDEGEIFRRLLIGETLTPAQLDEIRAENDWGTVTVDGKRVSVEFWNPFGEIADGLSSAAHWVGAQLSHAANGVAEVVGTVGQWSGQALRSAWDWGTAALDEACAWSKHATNDAWEWSKKAAKSTWSFVKDEGARWWDAGKTIVNGVRNALLGVGMNVAELVSQFGKGVAQVVSGDAEGWKNMGLALLKIPQTAMDAVLMVGGSLVSAAQTVAHLEPVGRSLRPTELDQLRPIFGESIDYEAVVVKEGDSGVLTASGRAFVLGNTIYLPDRDKGNAAVLAHEMTHVWQNQNGGTDYASEALTARYVSAESERAAYDWTQSVPGARWSELNPEQQGAFIESAMANGAFEHQPPQFMRAPYGYAGSLVELNRYLDSALAQIRAGLGAP